VGGSPATTIAAMDWAAAYSDWYVAAQSISLLEQGRTALVNLHESLAAGCSMSRIDDGHLTVVDAVGHASDGEHVVGQRFPIDPPFGLVAMAWRDDAEVDRWLRGVTPRLCAGRRRPAPSVLADVRARGYGAWRFDDAHASCTTASPESWRRWSRLPRWRGS